ncbi:hypothetical protein CYMTET_50018 [Cymbomonas tetramitiformis]|uniref:Leishmanolysin n=1 Tax=Cymbomonas tetramitiformis TaxID=36881 RepID=A0AAE0EV67_9CHLO|nr:hypothetical protein CYMTET_50018 [Cymbomonas tetramitiformis]
MCTRNSSSFHANTWFFSLGLIITLLVYAEAHLALNSTDNVRDLNSVRNIGTLNGMNAESADVGPPKGNLKGFSCAHDDYVEPMVKRATASTRSVPEKFHLHANKRRRVQTISPTPIRIHAHYSLGGLDATKASFVRERLVPAATAAVQRHIKVKAPIGGSFQLPRQCTSYYYQYGVCARVAAVGSCGWFPGAATHDPAYFAGATTCDCSGARSASQCGCTTLPGGAGVPDTDYILYVTAADTEVCAGQTVGIGGHCIQDPSNLRPLAGFVNFCPAYLQYSSSSSLDEWAGLLDTAVHELLHGLAFSAYLFNDFIDSMPRGFELDGAGNRHVSRL